MSEQTAQNTFGDASPLSLTKYARTSSSTDTPSTPQIGCGKGSLSGSTFSIRVLSNLPSLCTTLIAVSHNSVELLWYPYPGATMYHIVRDGAEVGTTAGSNFADTVTLSTAASYAIWTSTGSVLSSAVSVTTLDPSDTTTHANCHGNSGHIRELNYANSVKKRWRINPMSSYSYITLTVRT